MKTSDKGVAFVAAHEGVVTRAYRDVVGVWTIGVGHTAAAGAPVPKAGMTITRAAALQILADDLPKYEAGVARRMGGVSQHVFDGAVSFHFNTGAIGSANWVGKFLAGAHAAAEASFKSWKKAGGRVVAGLVRRRGEEADLIFRNRYPAGLASVELAPPAVNPAAPTDRDEVNAFQKQLAALGFYRGAVDGIAGAKTRAAILAYQKSHPDLVADGIAGPATLASLARDIAARTGVSQSVGAAVGTAVTGAVAAAGMGMARPLLVAALLGFAALVLIGGVFAVRYRGEYRRALQKGS